MGFAKARARAPHAVRKVAANIAASDEQLVRAVAAAAAAAVELTGAQWAGHKPASERASKRARSA